MNIVPKTTELCALIANSAAPCFYVTLEEALVQYNLYKKGNSNLKTEYRRKMYAEIFARFDALMEASNGCAFKYSIMEQVLNQEAPSFYLKPDIAFKFYYNAIHYLSKKKHI